MYQKNEITYELFGIIPEEFYSKRFFYETVFDVRAEALGKAIPATISYQAKQPFFCKFILPV